MATTELNERKREEYEMQLFGFHSRAVYTTLKSLIQDRIFKKCKQLCDSIQDKCKLNEENSKMLDKSRRKLTKDYYLELKTHLPAIERSVNDLMEIPQHILLEEDKIQEIQYTDEEFETMKTNLEELQQKVERAKMLNCVLKDELKESEEFEKNYEVSKVLLNVLENSSQSSELDKRIEKLLESYKQLEKNLRDESSEVNVPIKRRCLTLSPKKIDIDSC